MAQHEKQAFDPSKIGLPKAAPAICNLEPVVVMEDFKLSRIEAEPLIDLQLIGVLLSDQKFPL
jgi:hypothetical protein